MKRQMMCYLEDDVIERLELRAKLSGMKRSDYIQALLEAEEEKLSVQELAAKLTGGLRQ